MAHTNQTSNYELSQFQGTDKPAWLVDYNEDMEKIDLGLKDAKDVADAAKTEADQGAIDIAAVEITANAASTKAAGAISDFSDEYDAASTYAVHDLVIYNNLLYECITAITVPEAFNGTHWRRTTIESVIDGVKIDLSTKQDAVTSNLSNRELTSISESEINIEKTFTLEDTSRFVKILINTVNGGTNSLIIDSDFLKYSNQTHILKITANYVSNPSSYSWEVSVSIAKNKITLTSVLKGSAVGGLSLYLLEYYS